MRRRRRSRAFAFLALLLASPEAALADEPARAGEPRLLAEPGEVTNVIDAFDGEDVFDLHLTLGYQYTWKRSHIRRELSFSGTLDPNSAPGFTTANADVATYEENTSRLNTRVDIGVYHDIALYVRMPIVLSNERKLTDLNGSEGVQSVVLAGGPADGVQLFNVPFQSPKRGGIEYLALGLDADLMNQYRDPSKPTWMAGLEVRLSVSEPLHACNANPPSGQASCASSSNVNRAAAGGTNESGVSRGTTGLELHSAISKRIKYAEPYAGFRALVEFPTEKSELHSSDLLGSVVNHPPLVGSIFAGLEIMPWEQREQFQRLTLDGRVGTSYHSEGRDYSELFDPLGSSNAPSLRTANPARFHADPNDPSQSVADTSQSVFFNGVTAVSAYMSFQASIQATWQVGEYIKFALGGSYTREQSHFIDSEQQCGPSLSNDPSQSGPCASGVPNPNYRPTIDSVGRRFRTEDTNLWDAWLFGTVMF